MMQAEKIRAEFEANSHLDDPNQVERALVRGEARLAEHLHPDPYTGTLVMDSMYALRGTTCSLPDLIIASYLPRTCSSLPSWRLSIRS
jgi:hypothetical protein